MNDLQKLLRESARRYGISESEIEAIIRGDVEEIAPAYACDVCKDIGVIDYSYEPRRLNEPQRWEYCPANCAKAQARRQAESARAAAYLKDSGVPEHYRNASLGTWMESYDSWSPKQQHGKLWGYLM